MRSATATEAVARQRPQRPAHGHTTSARPGHTATQVPIGALAGAWMAGMTMPARQHSRAPQLGVDTSTPTQLYSLEATAVRAQSRTCDQPIVTSAATARLSTASWRSLGQICQLANGPSGSQSLKKESPQAAAAVTGKRTLDGAAAPATSSPSRSAVAALRVHPRCPWPVL